MLATGQEQLQPEPLAAVRLAPAPAGTWKNLTVMTADSLKSGVVCYTADLRVTDWQKLPPSRPNLTKRNLLSVQFCADSDSH